MNDEELGSVKKKPWHQFYWRRSFMGGDSLPTVSMEIDLRNFVFGFEVNLGMFRGVVFYFGPMSLAIWRLR